MCGTVNQLKARYALSSNVERSTVVMAITVVTSVMTVIVARIAVTLMLGLNTHRASSHAWGYLGAMLIPRSWPGW